MIGFVSFCSPVLSIKKGSCLLLDREEVFEVGAVEGDDEEGDTEEDDDDEANKGDDGDVEG